MGRWCLRAGCNLSVHPARHVRGARVTSPAASMWWPTFVLCMGYPTLSAHASPRRSVQAVLVRRTKARRQLVLTFCENLRVRGRSVLRSIRTAAQLREWEFCSASADLGRVTTIRELTNSVNPSAVRCPLRSADAAQEPRIHARRSPNAGTGVWCCNSLAFLGLA